MSFCRAAQNAARWRIGNVSSPIFTATVGLGARRLSTVPLYEVSRRNTSLLYQPLRRNFWSSTPSPAAPATTPPPQPEASSSNAPATTPPPQPEEASSSNAPAPLNHEEAIQSSIVPAAEQKSGIAAQAVSSDPSSASDTVVSALADSSSVESVVPALQLGDLHALGQAGWGPVGWIQTALEFIHVTTGLPWWGTLVVTTILVRAAGIYFAVNTARVSSNLMPYQKEMATLMEQLKEAAANRELVKQQRLATRLRNIRADAKASVLKTVQGPAYQIISSVCFFIAVRRLCNLPLPQLQDSSFFWIPDLTGTDSTYILPILMCAGMIVQARLGRTDAAATGSEVGKHLPNVVPFVALLSFFLFQSLPAAVMIHFVTNLSFMSLQSAALRSPRVREALNFRPLPKMTSEDFPSMQDTWNATKQYFKDKQLKAELAQKKGAEPPAFLSYKKHETTGKQKIKLTDVAKSK
ncbi:hypothetical protein M422DRAFT_782525 [Sphaerobolus stellatus SS14]|uniref:Membrane insertase YidC/Oxa/ALB C-terminal domain-containing protein n=1 Tax=Sphaerobolus stellatus (strain SS14) TaxID=990650 RepID=A0A0C9UKW2_SPHS4|nr:hypothetical protein M422DRAFT_782525 [Sphaerobolus stellatus SS14]